MAVDSFTPGKPHQGRWVIGPDGGWMWRWNKMPKEKEMDVCDQMAEEDEKVCQSLSDPGARSRCYSSANERYGACRTGKTLPPLITW